MPSSKRYANSTAVPATLRVARPSVGSQQVARWQLEEVQMDAIRLPRHVIERLEHRWASRLQQDAKAWTEKGRSVSRPHVRFFHQPAAGWKFLSKSLCRRG
jgi:hypothetical protein